MKRRGRRATRKMVRKRKASRRSASRRASRRSKQRGGAAGLPEGYDYTMAVSYTPKSDKIGSPDEVPRVGGRADFMADVERTV
jgi:hypothetical protein